MNANDKALLISFLDDHAETLGNNGCNDWTWPKHWNEAYRREFLERFNDGEDIPVEYHHKYGPSDFMVLAFIVQMVKEEIK